MNINYKYIFVAFLTFGLQQQNVSGLIPLSPKDIVSFFEWAGYLMQGKSIFDTIKDERTEEDEIIEKKLDKLTKSVDYINANVECMNKIVKNILKDVQKRNSTNSFSVMKPHINYVDSEYDAYVDYLKIETIDKTVIGWVKRMVSPKYIGNIN